MPAIEPLATRFWRHVHKRGPDDCWLWVGATHANGYGSIKKDRERGQWLAHRAAWHITNGSIPDGMLVCHRCDTPTCVNPGHLFIGTASQNTADMVAKGRYLVRGRHINARLTVKAVKDIRRDCRRQEDIAAAYGISQATVSDIKVRRTWKHIP